MIESNKVAAIATALEALHMKMEYFEKVLQDAQKYDQLYFNEEVLFTAAKQIAALNRAKAKYRFKLYLGLVKYALVWYDFPTREMRQRRDNILILLSNSQYKQMKKQLVHMAEFEHLQFSVLLTAMHYFMLDPLELFDLKEHQGTIDKWISNAQYWAKRCIESKSDNIKVREPERYFYTEYEERPDFLALQWRNHIDAIANYQLFAEMNKTSILRLVEKMDKDVDIRTSLTMDESKDPYLFMVKDVLKFERVDMEDYMIKHGILKKEDKGTCRQWLTGVAPLFDVQVDLKTTPRQVNMHEDEDLGVPFLDQLLGDSKEDDGGGPEVNPLNKFHGAASADREIRSPSWADESESLYTDQIESIWDITQPSLPPPAPAQHAFVPTDKVTRAKSKAEAEQETFVPPKPSRSRRKSKKGKKK